jgi:integrase
MLNEFLSSFSYAATTKRTYADILSRFLSEIEKPQDLTASGLVNYIENKTQWGNARRQLAIAAIRKFLTWRYGQSHPAIRARIKRTQSRVPRTISRKILDLLLASFDRNTPKGARDLAIAGLLIDTGLRESEICRIQQADLDSEKRTLQVVVKGGNLEWAVFAPATAADIEHWKIFRQTLNPRGALFVHVQTGEPLKASGLQSIVREWGKRIGVKMSPHDFRRGMATIMSENGAPDRQIMEAGRWHSVGMVQRYTRAVKLEAVRQWLPREQDKNRV